MLIINIILVWLLISAWLTAWGMGEDLGFMSKRSWLRLVCSLLFSPIIKLIIYPIEEALHRKKTKKR